MNYWIVCLPREDMDHCIRVGTFGRNGRHIISNVQAGDGVACVVSKEKPWKLVGIGVVSESYYVDDTKVFKKDGLFPDRFDFKVERANIEYDFDKVVGHLGAVTHPEYWPVYFKNGMVKISQTDWELLVKEFRSVCTI